MYKRHADLRNISLPVKEQDPDSGKMETIISSIQKMAIKKVVLYDETKIDTTKKVLSKLV